MLGLWRKPPFDSDTLSSIWVMACRDKSPVVTAFSIAFRLGGGITPDQVMGLVKGRRELFRLGLTPAQSRAWKERYRRFADGGPEPKPAPQPEAGKPDQNKEQNKGEEGQGKREDGKDEPKERQEKGKEWQGDGKEGEAEQRPYALPDWLRDVRRRGPAGGPGPGAGMAGRQGDHLVQAGDGAVPRQGLRDRRVRDPQRVPARAGPRRPAQRPRDRQLGPGAHRAAEARPGRDAPEPGGAHHRHRRRGDRGGRGADGAGGHDDLPGRGRWTRTGSPSTTRRSSPATARLSARGDGAGCGAGGRRKGARAGAGRDRQAGGVDPAARAGQGRARRPAGPAGAGGRGVRARPASREGTPRPPRPARARSRTSSACSTARSPTSWRGSRPGRRRARARRPGRGFLPGTRDGSLRPRPAIRPLRQGWHSGDDVVRKLAAVSLPSRSCPSCRQ